MPTESSESGQQSDSEIGRPRLLQRVHEAIRLRHYSRRTEEAYVHWIKRLIYFHGKRHPETMGEAEVERLLAGMTGTRWLIANLLYGAGLRVMECLRLRVKVVDLSYRQVLVRDGKGEKDRVTMLPEKLREPLRGHLERVRLLHARVLARRPRMALAVRFSVGRVDHHDLHARAQQGRARGAEPAGRGTVKPPACIARQPG